jgi:hypothetical protein
MNTKAKIAVVVAVVLLIAGGIAFAQSTGNGNQGQNYPGPCYGGGGYGGCCGGRW